VSAPTHGPDIPSQRALRTMALVRWALLLAVGATAATTWWTLVIRDEAPTSGEPRFYCPMHPEITSHDPGTCPICFMTLEPIPEDLGAPSAAEPHDHEAHEPEDEPVPGSVPPGTAPVMLTTERLQASGIAVVPVARAATAGEIRWPAAVEALEGARAEVRVRTEAFVERLAVRESGVRVRRGQVLGWVVAPEILRAEEELLAAHRWRASVAQGPEPTHTAQVDDAAARRLELLGVTRAEIDAVIRSGQTRRRVPLRAPIDGTVTSFAAAVGTYASPETVLYEITDYRRVRVVASARSSEELALAGTARAVFRSRADGAELPLALELIEPTLDESSRAARVRFLADNSARALRPGDIGDVLLDAPPVSVLVVPRDAVIDLGRTQHVFVETSPGLFAPRIVTLGPARGELREILAGLEAGELVVSRGGFVLDSESRLAAALAPRAVAADAGPGASEEGAAP
jgi:Cu(I)/Ag(I) efflux system membrane fusion protein